ncbi:alpha/beta hydrolase [Aquabacterium sp. A7-Y]|uniref:alpha/beta hydrolase family protein n=1 Tax=Aquabacterium sp. A7-Y TaxID=1349605 RepID=UPI00223C9404|nr:alpha/beta hydrolase [Aquabacterium sp. A7-Y]MCW7542068.1 alpha/beta hydrolase [Aquabacterium sp. A7-Y]
MRSMFRSTVAPALALSLLSACGGGGGDGAEAEEARPHDQRVFTVDQAALAFPALSESSVETDRWSGVLDGAGYRIEVPKNWNGQLVMYAHGYGGTGTTLGVTTPPLRRYLIEHGYAWAASSYRANYYDVRAGVEDTNALALAFTKIAAERGRVLAAPSRIFITGHSMGGHVTAAAIEDETRATARHKVSYAGAVPMCGVMGDTELFDYFGAYQLVAQQLAGRPATRFPTSDWAAQQQAVREALFTSFPSGLTAQGQKLKGALMNLTGGARPIFEQGFTNAGLHGVVWGTLGGDGTINGILTRNVVDTTRFTYQFDSDPALSTEEQAFNNAIIDANAEPDANRLRRDGLRWIPKVNGQFDIPVVSLHTLGDMYVPFSMQQIYRRRVEQQGNGDRLVQRAIRAPSHCDFTVAEQAAAFQAMVDWADGGPKPAGDDVLDAATVAQPTYGCAHTDNSDGPDDNAAVIAVRAQLPACPAD